MALTEQEELELLELEELELQGNIKKEEPKQKQSLQQNILQKLSQPSLSGPLGGALGLDQVIANSVNSVLGGMIEPPAKLIARGGQAIESMISGKQPQNYQIPMLPSMGGNIDVSPAQNIGQAVGPAIGTALEMMSLVPGTKQVLGKLLRYENSLKQAKKAKVGLDSLRNTLGEAKEIALNEVKDMPVEFSWKNAPKKLLDTIANKRDIYNVEFTQDGSIVNTVGNLDKIKSAVQDILTTRDYVEAGNMEKRLIKRFAGDISKTIVNTTKSLGKPELSKALKDYHNFMDNYEIINDHLVDKYGNALANKLKSVFKFNAEPLTKEAWKEVSKSSPEIKSVMNTMNRRELLKNLLKVTGVAAGVGLAGKGGIDLITSK